MHEIFFGLMMASKAGVFGVEEGTRKKSGQH